MTAGIAPLTARPAWKGLEAHHEKVRDLHLRTLFENDPKRGERLTAEAAGLYLDSSKNRVTDETLDLLLQLAEEPGLRARIDAMFGGEKINITENRAVLHVALRAPRETSIVVDPADAKGIAGRDASGKVLNVLAQSIPWFRRPAIRLSALIELPSIFVFTHDALGDGEDGPTHQPVEHLASLRAIPGLVTLRPGDANEVVEAYRYALQLHHQPAVLVLSRQPLPTLDRRAYAPATGVARCASVLADAPGGNPEVILIASGSELSLAVQAHDKLLADGIRSRVVSMPSWEIFDHQTPEYRDSVLPPTVKARVAVEQASTFGWERYVGSSGHVIGMRTFGASAPLKALQAKFGFEPDRVAAGAKELLGRP